MIQKVFRRYEIKYLITAEQKRRIVEAMPASMHMDEYGPSVIRNLYLDTDTFRLIRRSQEKPVYKEKLRIRSYQRCSDGTQVFVELKKKFKDVVYKRRITMGYKDALEWLIQKKCDEVGQIKNEIDYLIHYYKTLHPVVFLSYEREAYISNEIEEFRITFDSHLRYRTDNLTLNSECTGTLLMDHNQVLMEIKCLGGIPLWLTHILNKEKIVKASFSKVGKAYEMMKRQEIQKDGTDF